MTRNKLLVFCIDALCSSDIEAMKELPNFSKLFAEGSYVKHVEPIYPSLTYPCHVSIMTGVYADKHGIPHNERVQVGMDKVPWYTLRRDVKSKLLTDYAKEAGYSTCSISWPVTGGADIDLNMPMIVPMDYHGQDPIKYMIYDSSTELLDRYYWKYGHYLKGKDRSLDLFTMALAPDIIRDYHQPDVMFVKMCDLDTKRHNHGVYSAEAKAQLQKHDQEFGILLDRIKEYGDYEHTNFVVLGDHGQSDIDHVLNVNVLLAQKGFIKLDENGKVADYDAYCHSCALSAWIELKDPRDNKMREKVQAFLEELKADPQYGIGYLFNRKEALHKYHLCGPFDFVLEGERPISFGTACTGDVFSHADTVDYKTAVASHGGLPFKDETTTFIASGPAVKKGVVVERTSMVDEAPTMAAMLGLTMKDIDGLAIAELLK